MSGVERIRFVPAWSGPAGAVGGFGTRAFGEEDLRMFAAGRGCRAVWLEQIHSGTVQVIDGIPPAPPRGDALVTDQTGLLLAVKTADCLPLLLADERRRVVAAVHAGWRGTKARITEETVRVMAGRFGVRPEDLAAAMGPCIGRSCYEVGEDVRTGFREAGFPDDLFAPAGRPGKFHFDLGEANARQLRAAGVSPDRIFRAAACTLCDPELFSFRRDRNPSDRLFSFIGLPPA